VLRKLSKPQERDFQSHLGLKVGGFTIELYDASMARHRETNSSRRYIPDEFLAMEPVPFDPTADHVNRSPIPLNPGTMPEWIPNLNADDDRKAEFEQVPEQKVSQLLPVLPRQVGEDEVNAVNARDLHRFLGVGKQIGNWIVDRIQQFGFTENKDFEVFPEPGKNLQGRRPTKDYALTLEMAKELAMAERTPRGKQARLYFIEVEKQWRAAAPALKQERLPDQDRCPWRLGYWPGGRCMPGPKTRPLS
jgi:phage anti-repressor protein